jgi:hypothetical protein
VSEMSPADTRVFLFHSPNAAADASSAMDKVNAWLGKDRRNSAYPNLKIVDISVTSDGAGGVYTLVVCNLGASQPREDF